MKKLVTQERLKELLHYDPLTGEFVWLIRTSNRVKVGDIAGTNSEGYILISVDGRFYRAHILAWLYEYGYLPEYELDHKDRVRHHNWIDNLREVTRQCNTRNTGNRKNNSSGVKGVTWDNKNSRWKAQVMINGKTIYLGNHKGFTEAVCHRLAAEQAEGWEGCDRTSPAYQYVMKEVVI